ncbi:MAG: MEDS domain-containing protein [Nitrospiraceae bacterium]|nr:MEDS domain-containing protein [Nitrospiraceae bacterium]
MQFDRRKSGISLIDDLPWGSHFCQFYQAGKDLLDKLVPYFRAGLESNELCVWVTTEPLSAEDVRKALEKAVPNFENYAESGQIEIIPDRMWLARGGKSGKAIVSRVDKAVSAGFDGLRMACNAFREKEGSKAYSCYGADAIGRYNAIAVFTYPRNEFDAIGLMEVVKNHRFALVRNADRWEVIESSEARTVKDALKRSEEKLQSLFSNMSEGFAYHRVVLDARGKPSDYLFLEVNDAFERLTGLKGKDVIGKRVTEALPGIEKDPADWIGKYGKVAMTGRPAHFESYSESLKRWYSVSAFSPHKGFFAVTLSDITERKRGEEARKKAEEYITTLNEKLKRNVEELSSANKELEAFSYTVSHDLRSPLRSIDGFSQEILEDYGDKLDNNGVDALRRIRAASQRMGLLIDGLLNLSRLSRSEIVRGTVDLSLVAHDIAGDLRKDQPGRSVEIVIAEGLMEEGDERLLYVLLQNLLGNAWKFTGKVAEARLEFGVNQIDGEKAYFVRDNGAGFDMAFAGKLFRPFQRLHDTVDFSGTGIGLATVQRIVHRHGGRIWAEGEVGKGTTFYFTLK